MELLTTESPKTVKGEPLGWLTGILYLAPAEEGEDGRDICGGSSPGCEECCLFTSGRGRMPAVQSARLARRAMLFERPDAFRVALESDIEALVRKAKREGLKPCVRLNGTSDLDWTGETDAWIQGFISRGGESILQRYQGDVLFYDYTKIPRRLDRAWCARHGLDLSFSRSEKNQAHALRALRAGWRVSVVFDAKPGEPVPESWHGWPVVDGDDHDLTFIRPGGVVLGLRAKGRAKRDETGFVVRDARAVKDRAA